MRYLKKYNENNYLSKDGKVFDCSNQYLNNLPSIPDTVEILWCFNNELEELPPLPDTVEMIDCSNNNLKELPRLSKRLKYLNCSNNNNLPYYDLEGYWKWFYKENPDLGEANKMGLI